MNILKVIEEAGIRESFLEYLQAYYDEGYSELREKDVVFTGIHRKRFITISSGKRVDLKSVKPSIDFYNLFFEDHKYQLMVFFSGKEFSGIFSFLNKDADKEIVDFYYSRSQGMMIIVSSQGQDHHVPLYKVK